MNIPDLVTMIGNLTRSLAPIQKLITGGAYLFGILFFITAISKLKKIGDKRTNSSSQEKMFTPMMYLLFGSALLYLPSALSVMADTAFGAGNVLTYGDYSKVTVLGSMRVLIRTAGLLWFVRGCILVAHASEPGVQEGPKGLAFIIAGVLAINFDNSVGAIDYVVNQLISLGIHIKVIKGT